jgi:dihydroxyacid dehydratase/phosphogluconate dehydratase
LVEHRERDGDYIVEKHVLKDVKTPRSKKEIKAIEKQLEDAAIEKARREVQQTFPKSAETAQNGPCGQKHDIPA